MTNIHPTWITSRKQSHGFQYDFLNRLTTATYGEYNPTLSANNYYNTSYTYDNRGNMMTLSRQGFLPDSTYAQIDNLAYTYNTSSNRIKRVTDNAPAASKNEGFQPGLLPADYGYDDNGNMNYDPNKGMNIRYNYLNLPEFIEFSSCKIIEYTYDATGTKLKKTIKSGNAVTSTRDYVGDMEYKNQFLDAIYHPEGRLYFEDTIPRYEYVIKDHLGNARITFTDKDGNGTIDLTGNAETTEALEESHYYPFGMNMKGAWLKNEGRENRYLYNGKELDSDFGLDWYHYGARMYDAAIGRFTGVDPLADKFAWVSPFNYAENEPVANVDLWGLQKVSVHIRNFAPFNTFGGGFSGDGADRRFSTSQKVTSRVKQSVNIDFDQDRPIVSGGIQTSDQSHHPILGTDTAPDRNALKNVQIGKTSSGAKQVSFQSEIEGANPLTPNSITPNIDTDGIFSLSSNQETGVLSISAIITGDKFPSTESFISDSNTTLRL